MLVMVFILFKTAAHHRYYEWAGYCSASANMQQHTYLPTDTTSQQVIRWATLFKAHCS